MLELIKKYIYDYFSFLTNKMGFIKERENNEEQSYSVDFRSSSFIIRIEKYRKEFYLLLFKPGYEEHEINLFNLIHYMNKDNTKVPTSNYFSEIKDTRECFRKQLEHIATILNENIIFVRHFFETKDYRSQLANINEFMQKKYPELFKRNK
jgi:hypothetical protein